MTKRFVTTVAITSVIVAIVGPSAFAQTPLGSGFTYQGQLNLTGSPVNDTADFGFTLWDADTAGNMIGSAVGLSGVTVVDGLFTVELDFGVAVFNGEARWLEVSVASPSGGTFTTLSPRQPLTGVPYSLQTRGIYVNSAGNVGIGTTTPGAKLGVVGDMRLSGKLQSSSGNLDLSGGGAGVNVLLDEDGGSNDAFVISDSGVERFRVDGNTGTVTAPAFVGDGSGLTGVSAPGDNLGDHTATEALNMNSFDINNAGTVTGAAFVGDGSGLSNLPSLWNEDFGDIYYEAGNVGIGTHVPTELLTIIDGKLLLDTSQPFVSSSTITIGGARANGNTDPATAYGILDFQNFDNDASATRYVGASIRSRNREGNGNLGSDDGDLFFATTSDQTLIERMVITSDGNIGIGTSSPATMLDVRGEISFGNNGSLYPPAYDRRTFIVAGKIAQDGSIDTSYTTSGAIAGSVRVNDGDYTVTFAVGTFAKTPIITVQPSEAGNGDSFRVVALSNESTTGFHVKMKDRQGDNVNAPFHFTAIGER